MFDHEISGGDVEMIEGLATGFAASIYSRVAAVPLCHEHFHDTHNADSGAIQVTEVGVTDVHDTEFTRRSLSDLD